jgi:hypothetical protein
MERPDNEYAPMRDPGSRIGRSSLVARRRPLATNTHTYTHVDRMNALQLRSIAFTASPLAESPLRTLSYRVQQTDDAAPTPKNRACSIKEYTPTYSTYTCVRVNRDT